MKEIKLSKNLTLQSVQENNFSGNKLKAVVCYFSFFGESGVAYVSTDKMDSEWPSFGMTEISSELSDSFNELLDDNWEKIVKEIKRFIKQWERINRE